MMKTVRILLLCVAAAIAGLLAGACTHDEPEEVSLENYQASSASKSGFTVISESDCDACETDWNCYDFQPCEDDRTKATYTNMVSMATGILSSAVSRHVHQVIGSYRSTDIHGNPITVSGKIFYPKSGDIRNVILASHYTIGANFECPSESYSFEGIYAAYGYAVVIADYIGFGITRQEIHPYLQSEACARNVIDMGLAAIPFLKERGLKIEDDSVILLGYSQGGACTLHVQRMLEQSEEYAGVLKIKKNYCGAGPHDIAKTYDYSIKQDKTGIPCAIPMIVQGMSIGMSKPLDMSYFFREPLKSNYKDWLNSKNYTVPQISALIGKDSLSEILTDEGCDKTREETARFYMELKGNSIPTDYYPVAPLFLFHSQDDQTVPFLNSQIVLRQIRQGKELAKELGTDYNPVVEYDFGHYGDHQSGATKFFLTVLNELK